MNFMLIGQYVFAKEEISCLKTAIKLGGKIRVGFENSFLMPDGSVAPNNETRLKRQIIYSIKVI